MSSPYYSFMLPLFALLDAPLSLFLMCHVSSPLQTCHQGLLLALSVVGYCSLPLHVRRGGFGTSEVFCHEVYEVG